MDSAPESLPNPETGGLALFGPRHGFWVPPAVDVQELSPIRCARRYILRDDFCEEQETTPYLVYPVPNDWQCEVTVAEAERLRRRGYTVLQRGFKKVVVEPEALPCIGWRLEWGPRVISYASVFSSGMVERGWQWKTETRGLLNSFLALAKDDPVAPQTIQAAKSFVSTWGPLWLCRNPEHFDCHWSDPWSAQRRDPCMWAPVEEVREVVRKAWQACAAVEVAKAVRYQRPIPEHIRPYLLRATLFVNRFCSGREDPVELREALAWLISFNLAGHGTGRWGPRFDLVWNEQDPELRIVSGLGVIPAIWMEIAQAISDRHAWLQCDGCKRYYLRTWRRPAAGRHNFCLDCRDGKRGSKRVWYHNNRGKTEEKRRTSRTDG